VRKPGRTGGWTRKSADLVGVRAKAAQAKLPEAEREAWRKLWAEVDDLIKRAVDKT
jgi:hypothetical protein